MVIPERQCTVTTRQCPYAGIGIALSDETAIRGAPVTARRTCWLPDWRPSATPGGGRLMFGFHLGVWHRLLNGVPVPADVRVSHAE
jgi:hypothetical protein